MVKILVFTSFLSFYSGAYYTHHKLYLYMYDIYKMYTLWQLYWHSGSIDRVTLDHNLLVKVGKTRIYIGNDIRTIHLQPFIWDY